MNLDYYKTFYYVALSKNFTKAAELLGNNQPNVTRSMNNLEAELGCRLFARSNRGVSLTPIGEQLFQYVSAAMNNLEQGEEEIKKTLNIENGLVTIGSSETALRLMLLERLGSFHEEHPKIHFLPAVLPPDRRPDYYPDFRPALLTDPPTAPHRNNPSEKRKSEHRSQ